MAEQLAFSDSARFSAREASEIAACLVRVLGPAMRGYPAIGQLLARCAAPEGVVVFERERCLDACAELLHLSTSARKRGRDVDAFALEGVEARLLDALVQSEIA